MKEVSNSTASGARSGAAQRSHKSSTSVLISPRRRTCWPLRVAPPRTAASVRTRAPSSSSSIASGRYVCSKGVAAAVRFSTSIRKTQPPVRRGAAGALGAKVAIITARTKVSTRRGPLQRVFEQRRRHAGVPAGQKATPPAPFRREKVCRGRLLRAGLAAPRVVFQLARVVGAREVKGAPGLLFLFQTRVDEPEQVEGGAVFFVKPDGLRQVAQRRAVAP